MAQTALELLDLGFRVQVPADAVASRHKIDWEFALRRLEQAGAVVSTTEAVLFEWTETADRPEFKAISELIKTMNRPAVQLISGVKAVSSWSIPHSTRLAIKESVMSAVSQPTRPVLCICPKRVFMGPGPSDVDPRV